MHRNMWLAVALMLVATAAPAAAQGNGGAATAQPARAPLGSLALYYGYLPDFEAGSVGAHAFAGGGRRNVGISAELNIPTATFENSDIAVLHFVPGLYAMLSRGESLGLFAFGGARITTVNEEVDYTGLQVSGGGATTGSLRLFAAGDLILNRGGGSTFQIRGGVMF